MNDNQDLGGHNHVLSPARTYERGGRKDKKIVLGNFNDENLCKYIITFLEQSMLDVAGFVRKERLRRIKKNKKKQQEQGKKIYILLILINLLV